MSDAYNDAARLRQELGDLWPRLKSTEARLADLEAERELIVLRAENAEAALAAEAERCAECERLLALSQTAKILRTVSRPPLQFICSLCGEPVHDGDCAAMGGGT